MSKKMGECVLEGCTNVIRYFAFHKDGIIALPLCKEHAVTLLREQKRKFGLQGQLRVAEPKEEYDDYPAIIESQMIMWNTIEEEDE